MIDLSEQWRDIIDKKYLYVNRQYFIDRNQDVPRMSKKLKDEEILIKLGGIRQLLNHVGYSSVKFEIHDAQKDHVAATCVITFLPEGKEVTYSGVASVHEGNADFFSQSYAAAVCSNRAFVRCVRNFLNINVVCDEELNPEEREEGHTQSSLPVNPRAILAKTLDKNNLTLKDFKDKYLSKHMKDDEMEEIVDVTQLDERLCFVLIKEIRSTS